jgi:protein tyrosine/serine phosphatase
MKIMLSGMTVLAVILTTLTGCYQEVKLDDRKPGDLLPIAGAYNLRDLGGYTTTDGKTVKSGKLIRSGDLNMLTSRDQNYLFSTLGVKYVVDFRGWKARTDGANATLSEQAAAPDRVPSVGVTSVKIPTAIEESLMIGSYSDIIQDGTATPDTVIQKMKDGYANLLTAASLNDSARTQYRAFFDTLLASSGDPVLFHCSAGKDRTGIATMLLLAALGLDKETIIRDYLLSAPYVAEKYYPVGYFIAKSTGDGMKAQRDSTNVQQAAVALNSGNPTYIAGAKAGIEAGIRSGIEESVIAKVKAGLVDSGMADIHTANAMSKAELDGILAMVGPPTIDQMVAGAIALLAPPLNTMVDAQAAQLQALAAMSNAAIDAYAQAAAAKIAPLLSVQRGFIEAAFAAIEGTYTGASPSEKVVDYLTTAAGPSGGLGLSPTDIATLKSLYLE